MEITRTKEQMQAALALAGEDGMVAIKLTPQEMEQIFRKVERQYELEDAYGQFQEYWEHQFGEGEKGEAKFAEIFGFSVKDVANEQSEHYLLGEFADAYEVAQDCNQADNDVWPICIRQVLVDNAVNFRYFYEVDYRLEVATENGWKPLLGKPFGSIYDTLDELRKDEPDNIAQVFRRYDVLDGSVAIEARVRMKKIVGNNRLLTESHSISFPLRRLAEMKGGKLFIKE